MHYRSQLPFVAAVLLLPACDATGPDPRELRVALSVDASAPAVSMIADTLRVECAGTFRATATGPSGDAATWRGVVRRWFVGLDRTTPVQVDSMPAVEAIQFWQHGRLAVGDTAETRWRFWAGAPFILELEFEYQSSGGGPVGKTATTMECGIGEDVPTAAAPVIDDVTLDAPTPFQPGDAFTVSYRASGSAGLWQTAIVIDGAYQAIHTTIDSLRTASQQGVRLVVPQGVSLGRSLDISVQAMDALGQTSARVWRQSGPLVDKTPPLFNWVVLYRLGESMGGEIRMVGQYAVGDSIPFLLGAWDNQALGNATIDVGADRRVIPLSSPYEHTHEIHLRADAGWVGHRSLAVEVSDAVGIVGGRYAAHPDSFAIYPAVDRPVASWSAGRYHLDAAWDDARDLLYLTLDSVPEVVVLSTATMTVARTIPMPGFPAGVDLTVSGDTLAVTLQNRGSLAVVDLTTDQVSEHALGGAEWERVLNVVVLADNTALVEIRDAQGGMHVLRVALENGSVLSDTNVPGDDLRMARPRDRSTVGLYSWTSLHTCLLVYTAAADSYSPCRHNRSPSRTLASDPTGSRFIMAAHITDATTGAVTHPIWGIKPYHWSASTFSADGESIFVSDTRGLFRIRVSDGLVLERVPLRLIYGSLLSSADGSRLIAISNDSDDRFATVYRVMLQ